MKERTRQFYISQLCKIGDSQNRVRWISEPMRKYVLEWTSVAARTHSWTLAQTYAMCLVLVIRGSLKLPNFRSCLLSKHRYSSQKRLETSFWTKRESDIVDWWKHRAPSNSNWRWSMVFGRAHMKTATAYWNETTLELQMQKTVAKGGLESKQSANSTFQDSLSNIQ